MFQVQSCVHNVLDRIISPTDVNARQTAEQTKIDYLDLWNRINAVVL